MRAQAKHATSHNEVAHKYTKHYTQGREERGEEGGGGEKTEKAKKDILKRVARVMRGGEGGGSLSFISTAALSVGVSKYLERTNKTIGGVDPY